MKPRDAAVLALLGWYLAFSLVPGSRAAAQSECDSDPESEIRVVQPAYGSSRCATEI